MSRLFTGRSNTLSTPLLTSVGHPQNTIASSSSYTGAHPSPTMHWGNHTFTRPNAFSYWAKTQTPPSHFSPSHSHFSPSHSHFYPSHSPTPSAPQTVRAHRSPYYSSTINQGNRTHTSPNPFSCGYTTQPSPPLPPLTVQAGGNRTSKRPSSPTPSPRSNTTTNIRALQKTLFKENEPHPGLPIDSYRVYVIKEGIQYSTHIK